MKGYLETYAVRMGSGYSLPLACLVCELVWNLVGFCFEMVRFNRLRSLQLFLHVGGPFALCSTGNWAFIGMVLCDSNMMRYLCL
jgi:hypothetical protein